MKKQKRVLIFYSRLPCEGLTFKSRLGNEVGNQEVVNSIAIALILDLLDELVPKDDSYDMVFSYEAGAIDVANCKRGLEEQYPTLQFIQQDSGKDVEALGETFESFSRKGYEQLVLIGSDLPMISKNTIAQAFLVLEKSDVVIHPAEDNGYGLVGMNGFNDVFSDVNNWKSRTKGYHLVHETREICAKKGYSLTELQPSLIDIDFLEDLKKIMSYISENDTLKQEFSYLHRFFTEVKQSNLLN